MPIPYGLLCPPRPALTNYKSCISQYCGLPRDAHKHTTFARRNTHTSHTRAPAAPRLTIQTENKTSIISPTQTYNILQEKNLLQQCPLHNKHSHTDIATDIYITTRDNNKILRTPPPHIINPEETLPYHTRRIHPQLRTNKSPFLKSYIHKVDANSYPSPLFPLCNTHTYTTHIISSTTPT